MAVASPGCHSIQRKREAVWSRYHLSRVRNCLLSSVPADFLRAVLGGIARSHDQTDVIPFLSLA